MSNFDGSEIAIVGMACRFPGASTLEDYWRNLRDGVESIARLSEAQLAAAGVTPEEYRQPTYVPAAPILDDIAGFDAALFGYTPLEAELMDPQQRQLLECAWEALEHAGYTPEQHKGSIGVFAGTKTNTYLFALAANRERLKSYDFLQLVLGGDQAMLSTRISYKLDLKGPSYAVQTACSTSLVAVHMACQSLLIDECQMALAGAVAINVPHTAGYLYDEGGVLSPDGHCRPFDAQAAGTLFGSGAGMVVLKRLADAIEDGDTIHAIIRGSATNNDGAVKASFTAPSVDGQMQVILDAMACANVDGDTISYVEAHGTGTALGDPIEILALSEAYRASTSKRQFCAIGSVKSNLGHLDAAAGISSLIKTVLALTHRQLPPTLHYQAPNPRIDFASSPFFVNTSLRDWSPPAGLPRRAGVSSFGFGGTNAHVILEEAPALPPSDASPGPQLLLLSANSQSALEQLSDSLAEHLAQHPQLSLVDVAYTLQLGRKALPQRRALVCQDLPDAVAALRARDPQRLLQLGERPAQEQLSAAIAALRGPEQQRQSALELIGRAWLAGASISWAELYAGQRRRRIPLPAYPFEHKRYWIDIIGEAGAAIAPAAPAGKRAEIGEWLYRPAWQPEPLPLSDEEQRSGVERWLIFLDELGVGERLAHELERQGQQVAVVKAAADYAQKDAGSYTLCPGQPDGYDQLLAQLKQASGLPQRIVHLWGVTPREADESWPSLDEIQERGFYSLLYLAQALGRQQRAPLRIDVITNEMQPATGLERLQPEKATLLGPCKVIPQEQPSMLCRSIDISGELDLERGPLLGQLLGELLHPTAAGTVALRGGQRLVQRFEPLAAAQVSSQPITIREGGVYMIVGGLGGLGLTLAEYLARTARARLILTGRTALPEREQWDEWLETHPESDAASRKIRAVQGCEQHGAEVLLLAVDTADAEAMRAALEQAERRFGALHGVLHAAGVARGPAFRAIHETGRAESDLHFAPKTHGLLALREALHGRSLDFCLLQASLSSVLGGLGNVAYAAASAFMDAFAHQQRQLSGTRWISVDWDSWHQPGQESAGIGATLVEMAIAPSEGVQALQRILELDAGAQVVVSTGDLEARIAQWVTREPLAPGGASSGTQPPPGRHELARAIAATWERVLGLPRVGLDDNFFELGGNSLSGMQLISELKRELSLQLSPVMLFEAPTVNALTRLLVAEPEQEGPGAQPAQPGQAGRVEIAIIGMAGRFPGADTLEDFWQNLRDGVEQISFFSQQELEAAGIPAAITGDPRYVKARPVLGDVAAFDAAFFGYTPREASLMDPQHRLFMECAWEALERAGYVRQPYGGAIGIYAGSSISTYLLNLYRDPGFIASVDPLQTIIGNDKDSLTTSVSYKLNLKGPSMAVQTFCSTSLVAVHLACQSLARGECDIALAGGASIVVPQQSGYHYQDDGIVSPDGHCRPFDASAQGTLFGNGVGLVALKRLDRALAEGDTIYAVIKGSAINNDGSLKVGYTAPSVEGQAEVIAAALASAGVPADSISYVEAHGTGTALGDPIEVAALTRAFRSQTERAGFCALGSVKGNVGHLDRAAGVAALIKTVLALQHRQIPPSLHYQAPNPRIDFASSPFYVNATLAEWQALDGPRRAGVSALGFGGTNAHIILEEAPAPAATSPADRGWHLLPLSARTPAALAQSRANLRSYLAAQPGMELADIAHTLQNGRRDFAQRAVAICRDAQDALAVLAGEQPQRWLEGAHEGGERQVAFLLPGQGAQYLQMGRGLYDDEPVFRAALDRCAELLRPQLQLDLREVIYPAADQEQAAAQLEQTALAQPAVFTVSYALAQLWLSWGVRPYALLGHSLGEYVAACLAGVLTLEAALRLVATRGRLMQALPGGAMLSVGMSETELLAELGPELALAAINAARQCVASGPFAAIEALETRLAGRGILCRRLHTSHAFHSAMLEPIQDAFRAELAQAGLSAPQTPYISNLTGSWISAAEACNPDYWVRHMRQPVRFADGLALLLRNPDSALVEVGPGRTLSGLARQAAPGDSRLIAASLRHPNDQNDDSALLLATLGRLWLAGAPLEWSGMYSGEPRRRLPLPTYPFERQRFWLEPQAQALQPQPRPSEAGKRSDLADWFALPSWRRTAAPALAATPAQSTTPWLIFLDSFGLGLQLAEQLRQRGDQVFTVEPGERYQQAGPASYAIQPDQPGDYEQLFQAMLASGPLPGRCVHMWGLSAAEAAFEQVQRGGFYSLLALVQTLGKHVAGEAVQLEIISNGLHALSAAEQLQPAKATALGLSKVISQEHPTIICRAIDISLPGSRQQQARLIDQLVAEVDAPAETAQDALVVYRGSQRWVQDFTPLRLAPAAAPASPLRERGVYLLTGGLAEIGLALAEYLASTVRARLVLVEDPAFPAREQWPGWLASHSEQESVSAKIRAVEQLERLGAEVTLVAANLVDQDQMRAVVEGALTRYGAIHGVVYAASVVGEKAFRSIQELSREGCHEHFALKIHGLAVLEQVLRGIELDFCLINSSLSCYLGGRGYAAYAAANAFIDAFTYQHNSSGEQAWVSVNWDAWQLDKITLISQSLAQFAMTPAEGGEAFRRILAQRPGDQVIVSTGAIAERIAQGASGLVELRQALQGAGADPNAPRHPRPHLQTPYVAPSSEVERTIAEVWGQVLGFERIGVQDNFFELGGESLIAMQMVARLKQTLQKDVSVVSLYEQPTVSGLARGLGEEDQAGDSDTLEQRELRVSRRNQLRQSKQARRRGRGMAVEADESEEDVEDLSEIEV